MRKIGLLLIAVMMILPAMAQVSFGVRAGGAYSSLIQKVEDTYEAGARFGFSIAGLADIPLSKNKKWSLRPEVAFVNQGGAYYSNQDIHGMALHNKCWYYSLQIPVNVAYTFTFTDVHLSGIRRSYLLLVLVWQDEEPGDQSGSPFRRVR